MPQSLAALLPAEIAERMAAWGEPAYRAEQVFCAVQRDAALDPRAITTLPQALRERLAAEAGGPATEVLETQASRDGTTKFLLGLRDDRRVEAVLIPEGARRTVCVSTQVGCPIRCVFCASGVAGLVRNLDAAEIVEQLLRVAAHVGARPTNVVLMGMGEPLLNFDAVERALRVWTDRRGLGLAPRRITVSTAGTPARVDRLAALDLGVGLAVSLHAPDDETRALLVPGSPPGRTEALVEAARRYAQTSGRDATIEYVLIGGVNDRRSHAAALADRLAGGHLHVNLIPFNPVPHRPDLVPPSGNASREFLRILTTRGVAATLRTRRGEDIAAACGQLALERSLGTGAEDQTRPARGASVS